MINYVLLLGSNLGNSRYYLCQAMLEIGNNVGPILRKSEILITDPIGEGVRNRFHNQAVIVRTELDPESLLDRIEDIERKLGRKKQSTSDWNNEGRVYEDRTIDIDIVMMDVKGENCYDDRWSSERLLIPHKAISTRPFVKTLLSSLSVGKF